MANSITPYIPPYEADSDFSDAVGYPVNAQSLFLALGAIVIFAAAFGGGGSKYGMANLLVQLAALVALSFHRESFFGFWKAAPLALKGLVCLSILLPLAYLVPMPMSAWSGLPGRELVVQSYELIGEEGWASASVNPGRTLLALTALIAPLAVLTIGWSTPRDRLIMVGWIVVLLGLANFLIGVPQVLSNSEVGVLYPENPMQGVLFGTFASRNSAGLFLVCCLSLATVLPAPQRLVRAELGLRIGICVLLVVAIVLTRSRSSLVLALLPIALAAWRFVATQFFGHSAQTGETPRSRMLSLIPVALIIAAIGATVVAAPGRVGEVVERFAESGDDARAYIWEDAAYSADRFWPVGAGMGTFSDVFQIDESLENMTQRRAGRAHNDYLEVAIEAGLPGLILIGGWLSLLVWLSWRARAAQDRWIAWSGATILLVFALQSITDFPLRNMTMLTVGGFALVVLARFGAPRAPAPQQEVLP